MIRCLSDSITILTARILLQSAIPTTSVDIFATAPPNPTHVTGKKNFQPNPYIACNYTAIHPPKFLIFGLIAGITALFMALRDVQPITEG